MAMQQTWRWFGPQDPIDLEQVKQTGATGVVTALHQVPVGEIWTIDNINERKQYIENAGLSWSVVESLPVHEEIKQRSGNHRQYIENYKQSLRNLGRCGIDTVCYNFMPVLDWSRTDLGVVFSDGTITTKFDAALFAAFDLYILERPGADKDYSSAQIEKANTLFKQLDEKGRSKLTETVLLGLPGSLQALTLEKFRSAVMAYQSISESELEQNLHEFIREIVPVAEEAGVRMSIHPDDPPWSLLGLPRIVGTKGNIERLLNVVDSPANGLTFCTGSLGAAYNNDLVSMAEKFSPRINFVHLRNLTRNEQGDFMEAYHLAGDVDLYGVIKVLLLEQKRRIDSGRKDTRLPMRPDHGMLMKAEQNVAGIYPGYSLLGRMRGLAELRGLEAGIIGSLGL